MTGANRSTIMLPFSRLKQFHEMVGGFVDTMKGKLEGMAGPKVTTGNCDAFVGYNWGEFAYETDKFREEPNADEYNILYSSEI
jgi:hypothetical protein